jgi:hypothetical protein
MITNVIVSYRRNWTLKDMHIDVAIDQLKYFIPYFKTYRETKFASTMILSKEIATVIEIKHVSVKNV